MYYSVHYVASYDVSHRAKDVHYMYVAGLVLHSNVMLSMKAYANNVYEGIYSPADT
jgi:hypothetical protein